MVSGRETRRILITGSRGWVSSAIIDRELGKVVVHYVVGLLVSRVVVVHGACPQGADALADSVARRIAEKFPVEVETHPADWSTGKRAGFDRNQKMASLGADVCLAFWDGESRGTLDMIQRAVRIGIPVRICPETTDV